MLDIATYLNRITSQHKVKPKYMALVASRLQLFIDLAECLASFDEAFDLDKAVGKQLDILGEYVGVNRLLDFQPQFTSPVLPDHYYRMLIKAGISLSNWDGTVEGINRVLGDVFPQYTITVIDNQDMTLNVQIAGLQSLFESELIKHGYITPKPMGVLIDYYVLLSIELDAALYLGGLVSGRIQHTGLPALPPPETNAKPPEALYIAGWVTENRVGMTVIGKPMSDKIDAGGGELFAAGMKQSNTIRRTVQSNTDFGIVPPPFLSEFAFPDVSTMRKEMVL